MTTTLYTAEGITGNIELTSNSIIIKRKGIYKYQKGDKEVLLNSISGIQFKNASSFTNGYIQFVFSGSSESKGGLLAATNDENTIIFNKKQQMQFEILKNKTNNLLTNNLRNNDDCPKPPSSDLNDLRTLAQLKDDGIITEEEFTAKKKKILGI